MIRTCRYTLHYFTTLVRHPAYLCACRMVYIIALLFEVQVYVSSFLKVRQVYYTGPNNLWNWDIVCSNSLGLGRLSWENGITLAERQRSYDASMLLSQADPVPDLTLTSWTQGPSRRTCGQYLLYMGTPFYQLMDDMWYASAAGRTLMALLYVVLFFLSFKGDSVWEYWKKCRGKSTVYPDATSSTDEKPSKPGLGRSHTKDIQAHINSRLKSAQQQRLTYTMFMQRVFLVIEGVYNLLFTVLVSFVGISVMWFYYAEELTPLRFSYIASGNCDGVAGRMTSSVLGQANLKCLEEIVKDKERVDFESYFVVYQSVLIFYVLTVIESIHAIEELDKEYNKNRMIWDTLFRLICGVTLFMECVLFAMGILPAVYSPTTWTAEDVANGRGPLENNYPSADILNGLSNSAIGLRVIFLLVYSICYCFVWQRCFSAQYREAKTLFKVNLEEGILETIWKNEGIKDKIKAEADKRYKEFKDHKGNTIKLNPYVDEPSWCCTCEAPKVPEVPE
jgi:hypothetical protein